MSQVGYGPPQRLDGPLPQKRSFTLLDVATIVPELDDHWLNGALVMPYPDDTGHVHDPCASGSTATKDAGTLPESPHFGAFTGYLPVTCTSFSVGADATWFRDRAVAAFAAVESTIAERVLATGEGLDALQPHLTDSNLDEVNGTTPTAALEALALLEQAIGDTGRAGVIHAAPATATAWGFGNNLVRRGNLLVTAANDTPVVVGAGYQGVFPDVGSAPSAVREWAFATGPLQARRTEIFITPDNYAEALDRALNSFEAFAERSMLIDWDGVLQAGVLVDRSI
jgi:hypothetical protein